MPEIPITADQVPQRQHNEDRMRRADSWLKESKKVTVDDEKFIFLWIAFNAAYGSDMTGRTDNPTESQKFNDFLRKILKLDKKKVIKKILWDTSDPRPVRELLDNRHTFDLFWKFVRGERGGNNWIKKFKEYNERVDKELESPEGDVREVLKVVFWRLYTLRNQILHGGTTFAEGLGRPQVEAGSRIMADLVPAIMEIMRDDIKENPYSKEWGKVSYPRIYEPTQWKLYRQMVTR